MGICFLGLFTMPASCRSLFIDPVKNASGWEQPHTRQDPHHRFIFLMVSILKLHPEATRAAWLDANLYAALSLRSIALWTTRMRMDEMVIGFHASMQFSLSLCSSPFLYTLAVLASSTFLLHLHALSKYPVPMQKLARHVRIVHLGSFAKRALNQMQSGPGATEEFIDFAASIISSSVHRVTHTLSHRETSGLTATTRLCCAKFRVVLL